MAISQIDRTPIPEDIFDGASASKALSGLANTSNVAMKDALAALESDPNDPSKLANFQATVNEWSVVMNLVSTVQKTMKDAMSSIIQKT